MVDRRTIYSCFVSHIKETTNLLTAKKAYYENSLIISNNKLDIYRDTIDKHSDAFFAVYSAPVETIDKNPKVIIFHNSVNVDKISFRQKVLDRLEQKNKVYDVSIVSLMKSITESYLLLTKEIKQIKRQLQLIDDKLNFISKYKGLSRNIVYYILSKINKYYEYAILNGDVVYLGDVLGFIKVTPKMVNGIIDWKSSLEYKDAIIKDGKLPYSKEDYLEAKRTNTKYEGVKWFVYYTDETRYYINWYVYNHKLPNREFYTFSPMSYREKKTGIDNIINSVSSSEEIYTLNIGPTEKLNALLAMNETQFIKYQRK